MLPPRAWQLEQLRRRVLDLFVTWGYQYVEPPVIEYLESLLVGSGEDLDLQTLKVIDQISGKQLGVRADMTSQAVRIDAHSLPTEDVQRLCYAGPVVFAHPQITNTSRVPFKAGAELFGAHELEADIEIVNLMLAAVAAAEVEHPVVLLGHMGIYRALVTALVEGGGLEAHAEPELFRLIQRKSRADIADLLAGAETGLREVVAALPTLMGEPAKIAEFRDVFENAPGPVRDSVNTAMDELEALAQGVVDHDNSVTVRLDVSELSGYGYHTGPVFAVYHPELGRALAQGGRYDGVGEVFGRSRAATGFDVNLKALLGMTDVGDGQPLVYAPHVANSDGGEGRALLQTIAALRAEGRSVRCALNENEAIPAACTHRLEQVDGAWQVVACE